MLLNGQDLLPLTNDILYVLRVCPTKSAISILDGSLSFNFSPSVWHHFLREYSLESRLLTCWPYHGFAYQRRYAAGDSRNNGSLKNNTMTTTLYLTFRNPIVKTRTFESPSLPSKGYWHVAIQANPFTLNDAIWRNDLNLNCLGIRDYRSIENNLLDIWWKNFLTVAT